MPRDEQAEARPPYLVVSGHDYRSTRRTTVHFLARELGRLGPTRFASVGYSRLSLIKGDPRADLWSRAGLVEDHQGVACYLWRSTLHPVNLRSAILAPVEAWSFGAYLASMPAVLRRWIAEAGTIIIESGLPVAFVEPIRQINPRAVLIYLCSDALQTINCARYLRVALRRVAPLFAVCRLASPLLASEVPDGCGVVYIPQGMDDVGGEGALPSPYAGGVNVVSVGSMLFDPGFFRLVAPAFPQCCFHIIGGGPRAAALAGPNLVLHGEMPHAAVLAFIRHAQVGVAPYDGRRAAAYLADSSIKLFQLGVFGVPAVCPQIVVGNYSGRAGYIPGDRASMVAALTAAVAHGRFEGHKPQSWAAFTRRLLQGA